MDVSAALKLFGLPIEPHPTDVEIEVAFRRIASEAHPDRGGSHEEMVKLLAARDSLLARSRAETALVPVSVIHELVVVAARSAALKESEDAKARESSKQIVFQSTNRLKGYRRIAAVAAALSAASLFLIKELPFEKYYAIRTQDFERRADSAKKAADDLYPSSAPAESANPASTPSPEQAAYDAQVQKARAAREKADAMALAAQASKDEHALLELMLKTLALAVAASSGLLAWLLTRRVTSIEADISELDELTNSRPDLFKLLRDVFGGSVPSTWSQGDLEGSLATWAKNSKGAIQLIVREVGPKTFATYLMKHAKSIELVDIEARMSSGQLIERYCIAKRYAV